MLRRVLKYIRDNDLLKPQDKVLVALSGGADSVALLDVLLRGGYGCVAAHCNFHLRGEESYRDERFASELCKQKGIRLVRTDFETQNEAKSIGKSIELTARKLRYQWFDTVARENGCTAIAVGHHQNDQAETVIMNLRRGAGIRGLCGMRPKNNNPYCPESEIPIIRPLLCTTHDYIQHYLKDIRHIDWVEDSTNTDTTYKRNAVRAELKTYTKAEIEHIAATARIMQGYLDYIMHTDSPQAKEAIEYETLRNNR